MDIIPGTKLTVTSDDRLEKDPSFIMTSSFEDVLPDGTYLISAPFFKEIQMPIRAGEKLNLSFIYKNASLSFDAEVLGRTMRDGLHYLNVRQLTEFTRTQKRQDFRVEIMLDGKLYRSVGNSPEKRRVRGLPIFTKDVSGSGALICGEPPQLNADENVVVRLPLGDKGAVKAFPAVVRRCYALSPEGNTAKWAAGIMFTHNSPAEKEALIRYLFKLYQLKRKAEAERREMI